jgi:DNA-binding transcriptional LysR family regulator
MDAILKLKAFIVTAEAGSFSDAARKLHASPSVIIKRINELEGEFKVRLFARSTRRLLLTEHGHSYLKRAEVLVKEYDDMRHGRFLASNTAEGPIRIRSSTVSTMQHLGRLFMEFQRLHPGVRLNVTLADQASNPIEQDVDVAIGFDQVAYDGVAETLLHPYKRIICGAPSYLQERGRPRHPHDLTKHRCISYSFAGPVWSFHSKKGQINVNVNPVITANNPSYLRAVAIAGHGLVQISVPAVADAIAARKLVPVLRNFPLEQQWMKMLVPEHRMHIGRIQLFYEFIKAGCEKTPPWA